MLSRDFILAGNAIFTLAIPDDFADAHDLPGHYTFRVNSKQSRDGLSTTWFAALLTGPDNEADYTYVGVLDSASGDVRLTKASTYTDDTMAVRLLRRALACVWADDCGKLEASGFRLHHEGRCGRCGRMLSTPESIDAGIGPECQRIMSAA